MQIFLRSDYSRITFDRLNAIELCQGYKIKMKSSCPNMVAIFLFRPGLTLVNVDTIAAGLKYFSNGLYMNST